MATARDIINGALRKATLLDVAEEADDVMASKALDTLNGILNECVLGGWLASHTTLAMGGTFALADAYLEPIKAAVAVRVAPEYGREVSPTVRYEASMFLAHLANAAKTATTDRATFEIGLWNIRPGDYFNT